jgi:hypothetical protein
MYLVAIAWMYVVLMMTVAEATAPNGTVLGAFFTFVLYGVIPVTILMYIMGTPMRRKARLQRESQELAEIRALHASSPGELPSVAAESPASNQPNAGCEAPADAITPVREKT